MSDYETRTICYLCEVHHAPSAPDPKAIQKLHNALFEQGSPAYSSFAVTPLGPVLTNPPQRPGYISQVAFLGDRIQFREELGGITIEDFAQRVREIVSQSAELRGIRGSRGQQVTIRSLVISGTQTSDSCTSRCCGSVLARRLKVKLADGESTW